MKIKLYDIVPSTVPASGWLVEYRVIGSTGSYTQVGPFMVDPIEFTVPDNSDGYEGNIISDCGNGSISEKYAWSTCSCPSGYTLSYNQCIKVETIPAILIESDVCFIASKLEVYSSFLTRVYNSPFQNSDLELPVESDTPDVASVLTSSYWKNSGSNLNGPMNRSGIWLDKDCDGNKDALRITSGSLIIGATYVILSDTGFADFTNVGASSNTVGTVFTATGTTPTNWGVSELSMRTTFSFRYENVGAPKTVYVGIGGDNHFILSLNGVVIADTTVLSGMGVDWAFKIWHIIPVTIISGVNDFNFTAQGDGSTNESVGVIVYDNDLSEINAASDDANLTILFNSTSLIGPKQSLATCPTGYSLDTSEGQGNYVCKKVTTVSCSNHS